jgi:uncharacterized protein YgfB (UPF0149 family)
MESEAESGLRRLMPRAIPRPMSTVVLELKEKFEQLTSEERYELMQILEDIQDNALADKAEASGEWVKLADLKKELGRSRGQAG